ncbi:MAG: multidrug efflux SMR transporter [Clostridia bacterium]|nr:multidrug efflux SMR transporter [Clostridia bacterium]
MHWILLGVAGILEIVWAIAMKYSDGFSNLLPSIITVVGYIASLVFLTFAMKQLPVGTGYAIWTGIGIIGTTVLGVLLFQEKLSLLQVLCLALIIIGVIGLRLLSPEN